MNDEQKRQISESIGAAKNRLLDALRVAESCDAERIRVDLDRLLASTETLQRKVSRQQTSNAAITGGESEA